MHHFKCTICKILSICKNLHYPKCISLASLCGLSFGSFCFYCCRNHDKTASLMKKSRLVFVSPSTPLYYCYSKPAYQSDGCLMTSVPVKIVHTECFVNLGAVSTEAFTHAANMLFLKFPMETAHFLKNVIR